MPKSRISWKSKRLEARALGEKHFINLNILVSLGLDKDFMGKKVKNGVI